MRELSNPLPLAACGDTTWQKTGWWRLTFVANGGLGKMLFAPDAAVTPPAVPEALPTDLSLVAVAAEEEEETEGTLYTPVVYTENGNNLTYIDICIAPKARGGGSGGRGNNGRR